MLAGAKLVAVQLRDIPESEVSECLPGLETSDGAGQVHCRTRVNGADLRAADLRAAEAWKAELRSADLTGANLEEASLAHSFLTGATLQWAQLEKAVLWGADLRAAVMLGVVAPGANLTCADLRGTLLKDAQLERSELVGADLEAADLRGSSIDTATLRASSDCDSGDGIAPAISVAWAELPNAVWPLLDSEFALFHLKGIAPDQRRPPGGAPAMDPERVQLYELGLAKARTEVACSDTQEAGLGAGGSLAEGIAHRIAAEYRHQDSQTPEVEDVRVRDAYFVVAGFLLSGHCDDPAEAAGAKVGRTLDGPDLRELERLRCLWIAQRSDEADAREALSETGSKIFGEESRVTDLLARDLPDEAERCRARADAEGARRAPASVTTGASGDGRAHATAPGDGPCSGS